MPNSENKESSPGACPSLWVGFWCSKTTFYGHMFVFLLHTTLFVLFQTTFQVYSSRLVPCMSKFVDVCSKLYLMCSIWGVEGLIGSKLPYSKLICILIFVCSQLACMSKFGGLFLCSLCGFLLCSQAPFQQAMDGYMFCVISPLTKTQHRDILPFKAN